MYSLPLRPNQVSSNIVIVVDYDHVFMMCFIWIALANAFYDWELFLNGIKSCRTQFKSANSYNNAIMLVVIVRILNSYNDVLHKRLPPFDNNWIDEAGCVSQVITT